MWIKRKILRFKFNKTLLASSDHSYKKPNRLLCEELFDQLSVDAFGSYNTHTGLETTLIVPYPNIEQYTNKLKEIVLLLEQKRIISTEQFNTLKTELSVDKFLISDDGFYINIELAILNFKNIGLKLCQLMKESDTATYGYYEHSFRMLTNIFVNIRIVTTLLISVSLKG